MMHSQKNFKLIEWPTK